MKQKNTLTLSSDFEEIAKVEPFLKETIRLSQITLFNNIQLAVTEAVTNAIIHGNQEVRSKQVEIMVQQNGHKIEITVEDEGEGFDPNSISDPTTQDHLLKQSGRGVYLIKQHADNVSFEKKGTLVRMVFIKPNEQPNG